MKWMVAMVLSLVVLGAPVFAGTLAQFRTVFGDIEVELLDHDKPVTVQNFIHYVQSGRFSDSFIHRCNPTFVIQGGGFYLANRGTTNSGISPIPVFGTISNEFNAGAIFSNTYGTIAMAKLVGDTNSATSQWFFNLTDNAFLDAPDTNNLFVVFGRVIRGTNVLNVFTTFKPYTSGNQTNVIADLRPLGFPFNEFPLRAPVLTETNLIFVDISLLNVQVQSNADGTRGVSWNSVSNELNRVEFTTNFPPTWQTLASTNGNGQALSVTDSNSAAPVRFYRVRVDY